MGAGEGRGQPAVMGSMGGGEGRGQLAVVGSMGGAGLVAIHLYHNLTMLHPLQLVATGMDQ